MSGLLVGDVAIIDAMVPELPLAMREMLARGPVDEDAEHAHPCCTVCRMVKAFDQSGRESIAVDSLDVVHTDKHTPDGSDGEVESYLRCLLIYLAAGWDGVHRVPLVCLGCAHCGSLFPTLHTDVSTGCCDLCGGVLLVVEFEDERSEVPLWASPV